MPTRYLILFFSFVLYGCGSQPASDTQTIPKISVKLPQTSEKSERENNNIEFGEEVKDWLTYTKNATDIQTFEIGLSEVIKRGQLEKIEELWDIDLAINNLSYNSSTIGKSVFKNAKFKERIKPSIKKLSTNFCSVGKANWHHTGNKQLSHKITSIFFRVMSDGTPQWCSFEIQK